MVAAQPTDSAADDSGATTSPAPTESGSAGSFATRHNEFEPGDGHGRAAHDEQSGAPVHGDGSFEEEPSAPWHQGDASGFEPAAKDVESGQPDEHVER